MFFVVLLPSGMLVEPKVAERLWPNFGALLLVKFRLESVNVPKVPQATATRAQVLQRVRFLISEMPGTAIFHEYGNNRSNFIVESLENAHQAYANLLQMLKDNPPIDCTEQECELCHFRQQLTVTPESLTVKTGLPVRRNLESKARLGLLIIASLE